MSQTQINAIISHFTIIGTLIVFLLNNKTKNSFISFYLRQTLGIHIFFMLNGWFVYWLLGKTIGRLVSLILLVLLLISLIGAVKEQKKIIPFLGMHFQNWFKSL